MDISYIPEFLEGRVRWTGVRFHPVPAWLPRATVGLVVGLALLRLTGARFLDPTVADLAAAGWPAALLPVFGFAYCRGVFGSGLSAATIVAVVLAVELGAVPLVGGVSTAGTTIAAGGVAAAVVAAGSGLLARRLWTARPFFFRDSGFEDEETGLLSRAAVQIVLDKEFESARRGRGLTVVMFRLRGFEEFRRSWSWGREGVEQVLAKVGKAFAGHTRAMDAVGRWGEDQFIAVLPGERVQGGASLAVRVGAKLSSIAVTEPSGSVVDSGIDIGAGVAEWNEGMEGTGELLEAATRALERAVKGVRGRVVTAE